MRAMKSQIFRGPFNDLVPAPKSPETGAPASCVSEITPACLLSLYNATGYVPAAANKNVLGVSGYLDQFANYADLQVRV